MHAAGRQWETFVLTVSGWTSETNGFPRDFLEVTTAGHAVVIAFDGTTIWDNSMLEAAQRHPPLQSD